MFVRERLGKKRANESVFNEIQTSKVRVDDSRTIPHNYARENWEEEKIRSWKVGESSRH